MKKYIVMEFDLKYDGDEFKVEVDFVPGGKGKPADVGITTLNCTTNHPRNLSNLYMDEDLVRAIEDKAADEWYEMTAEAADRCMR